MNEYPLMTLLVLTYNFEKYVAETLNAAFKQDYPNLEIVISDDCSTDGTWAIIEKMAADYRAKGGLHKIVLNRCEKNAGVSLHFEIAHKLCNGELIVYNDGDDLSHPARVRKSYEKWKEMDCKPWVIFSSAYPIDVKGNVIGLMRETPDNPSILGVAAYRNGMLDVFGPMTRDDEVTDEVYGYRALMLGPRGSIEEPLMKYRVGSGESSGYYNYRYRRMKVLKSRTFGAHIQLLNDVERIKERLGAEQYSYWHDRLLTKQRQAHGMMDLLGCDTFRARLRGFRALDFEMSISQKIFYRMLLLPHGVVDLLLNAGSKIYDLKSYLRRRRVEW